MRRGLAVVFTVVVLTGLASGGGAPATATLWSGHLGGLQEQLCARRDTIEVGIREKPLVLPCDAPNFEQLYLAYCTADEYTRRTGSQSQPRAGVREELVPGPVVMDVRETRVFFSQLRLEAQRDLGTYQPPLAVDFSEHFPPAMRQMTNDCGSCAMANGVSGVQARQFALWGSPWTPEEIVSPLSFSRKSTRSNCSLNMVEPFTFWRQEGAWTNDILPYGDGDCRSVSLTAEELAMGYPLRAAEYRQVVFVRDADYDTSIGRPDDLKRAIALGKNVQFVFGPLGSSWAHTLAIMGYSSEGVLYLNSWGADWGPNGDGTGIFTWDWLLTSGPIWPPFFSSPHRIWFYFNAASDWEGECDPAYVPYDYRGVCRASADLSVEKSGPLGPVPVGSEITYEISVINGGPDLAEDVVLTDHLAAGTAFVSASPGCSASGGTVSCTLDGLGADAEAFFEIVTVAQQAGFLTNSASVSSAAADPDPGNNTATHTTQVEGRADLTMAKTASVDRVAAGRPFSYTLSVTNLGPSEALGVVVTDTLPPGVTHGGASGAGWACGEHAGVVTCERALLAADTASTISVDVTAPASAAPLTNTATVSATTGDPNPGNNTATHIVQVEAQADLTMAKTASADRVAAGHPFSYTLTVTNLGPSEAVDVVVTDTLPVGVTYEGASGVGWACTEEADVVRCERALLGTDTASTISVDVTAPASASPLTNTATVSSATGDPTPINNTAMHTTQVEAWADLAIDKAASLDPVAAGQPFSYTLTITNLGPSEAVDVMVTDTLPAEISYGSVSGSGWACGESGGTVTCERSSLGAGDSSTITLPVEAPTTGATLENTAGVWSAVEDPDRSNNQCIERTAVMKLLITALVSPDPVVAGSPLTYTLWVTNAGAVDLQATITNTLPAQVSPGGVLTWRATIPAPRGVWGETAVVTAPTDYKGPITNVFQVTTREGIGGQRMTTSTVRMPQRVVFLPLVLRDR